MTSMHRCATVNFICKVFLLLVFLTAHGSSFAGDPIVLAKGDGSIVVYGGAVWADHFYTIDGDLRRFDTVGSTFSAAIFGTTVRYGIAEGIELNAEIPVGYLSLKSQERFPDRSIFAPVFVGIGGTLRMLESPLNASIDAMLKIPPGFHRGIYDDPDHPSFLSDGYLQGDIGLNVGARLETAWLKGRIGYAWRDEEPVDELRCSLQVGLTRVEGTGIYVAFEGVVPLADVTKPARPFYAGASGTAEQTGRLDGGTGAFVTIDRESYMGLVAGAYVNITQSIMLTGNYSIRLFGRNSLALGGAFLGVGYTF